MLGGGGVVRNVTHAEASCKWGLLLKTPEELMTSTRNFYTKSLKSPEIGDEEKVHATGVAGRSGRPLHSTCEQSLLVRSLAGLGLPPRDTWKTQTWPPAAGGERPEHHCLVWTSGTWGQSAKRSPIRRITNMFPSKK